jgi:hypothetical protein
VFELCAQILKKFTSIRHSEIGALASGPYCKADAGLAYLVFGMKDSMFIEQNGC